MVGKFDSELAEEVHAITLDGTCETMGDVHTFGVHYSKVIDFRDLDYIVSEDSQGFVTVEAYEHIDIDAGGYFAPVDRAWDAYAAALSEFYGDDDSYI